MRTPTTCLNLAHDSGQPCAICVLQNLQLDYVDLLLIHFPGPPAPDGASLSPAASAKKRLEIWRACETLYKVRCVWIHQHRF
jgi:diketogulonate reductase-like aldo/keto reductase